MHAWTVAYNQSHIFTVAINIANRTMPPSDEYSRRRILVQQELVFGSIHQRVFATAEQLVAKTNQVTGTCDTQEVYENNEALSSAPIRLTFKYLKCAIQGRCRSSPRLAVVAAARSNSTASSPGVIVNRLEATRNAMSASGVVIIRNVSIAVYRWEQALSYRTYLCAPIRRLHGVAALHHLRR